MGFYWAAPGFPELRQVDLVVLDEKPDGACTVRWTDPFSHRERKGPYLCDPERDPILKAPNYDGSDLGWESGFVVDEGSDKGQLYSLERDGDTTDWQIGLSDTLLVGGLLLTVVGLIGWNIGSLTWVGGVDPEVIRRARRLEDAAALVTQDYGRAVDAVVEARASLHRELVDEELGRMPVARLRDVAGRRLAVGELEKCGMHTVREVLHAPPWEELSGVGPRTAVRAVAAARRMADDVKKTVQVRIDADRPQQGTAALLVALQVLVEAGPRARKAAEAGGELTARLEPLLIEAAPVRGRRQMWRAGRERRRRALAAAAELRVLLDAAERDRMHQQFAQASVDLLRGPESDSSVLSAWVDFEMRPQEYYDLLRTPLVGGATREVDR
ncbi:hypothetical protein [Streptomyces carpinensis]|nr:hypothetical protein [Streptomyces carpinensis]